MSNQELAARIIELIGGNSNISRAAHCMTRLQMRSREIISRRMRMR